MNHRRRILIAILGTGLLMLTGVSAGVVEAQTPGNTGGDSLATPAVPTDYTPQEPRPEPLLDQAAHRDLESPTDPDERFEYVREMIESQQTYILAGVFSALDGMYLRQAEAKDNDPVFNVLYGNLLMRTPPGNPRLDVAARRIRRATELAPTFEYAWFLLGLVRLAGFQIDADRDTLNAARTAFERALEIRADFHEVHRGLAQVLLGTPTADTEQRMENRDLALNHIRQALAVAPESLDNWRAYVLIMIARAQEEQVAEELQAESVAPRIRYYCFGTLAKSAGQSRLFTQAYRYAVQALWASQELSLEELPQEPRLALYAFLAGLAIEKTPSDPDIAYGFLDRIFEIDPTYNRAILVLTSVAQMEGDETRLRQALDRWIDYYETTGMSAEEEGEVIARIGEIITIIGIGNVPREILWMIVLRQFERGTADGARQAMEYVQALIPIGQPSPESWIIPANLEGLRALHPNDLLSLLDFFVQASAYPRESEFIPPTHYLGAIAKRLRDNPESIVVPRGGVGVADVAQAGVDRFLHRIEEVFAQSATPVADKHKKQFARVLVHFGDSDLAPDILAMMRDICDAGIELECRRVAPTAYGALERLRPDLAEYEWRPQFQNPQRPSMEEIAEAQAWWESVIESSEDEAGTDDSGGDE